MNVLFVDDEPLILNGIKRAFYNCGWKISLTHSGQEALSILQRGNIDLIVTDMRMPQMDGAELLEKVTELYPDVVRIVLSGHANEEAAKRASFVAHQWLTKPCDPVSLKKMIGHIDEVRATLPSADIRTLVGKIKSLPSPPKTYMRLSVLLSDNTVNMEKIAAVISEDPSLAAKILQLSNSSFFVKGNQVTGITDAITRLGVDIVCSIVIAAEMYSQMEEVPGFSIAEEQLKSLNTARLASTFVDPKDKQETMLTGLLHNIGKLILYEVSPSAMKAYISQRELALDNLALENELFQVNHTQLSGYLLHLWNFPYSLIENVILHQQPEKLVAKPFGAGAAVYAACCLFNKVKIDSSFVEHFNLAEKLGKWKVRADKFSL